MASVPRTIVHLWPSCPSLTVCSGPAKQGTPAKHSTLETDAARQQAICPSAMLPSGTRDTSSANSTKRPKVARPVHVNKGAASGHVGTEKALSSVVVGGAIAPSTYDQPQRNWVSKPDCGRNACTAPQEGGPAKQGTPVEQSTLETDAARQQGGTRDASSVNDTERPKIARSMHVEGSAEQGTQAEHSTLAAITGLTSIAMALSVLSTSVTLVELWAGCCSLAAPMEALALPQHPVRLLAFSEKVQQARQFSTTSFPHAIDLGPYCDSMHGRVPPTPSVVAVSFDCAPYVICGRQQMQHDDRAKQIPQTIQFIQHVSPHLVWMEQAPEFYDGDESHGLLTYMNEQLRPCMASVDVFTMYDGDFGGYLHRTRGFKIWETWDAFYSLPPLASPSTSLHQPRLLVDALDPVQQIDMSLRVRGRFVPLQAAEAAHSRQPTVVGHMLIAPGSQWQVGDELWYRSRTYRIDKLDTDTVRMFPQTRWTAPQDTHPIVVRIAELRPEMARSHREAVFSIHTLCKSPRGWGEHLSGNIAIYLDDRLSPSLPRILSSDEKIRVMRATQLPGSHHSNYAVHTMHIMRQCQIPPQHVTKLMGRSITAAMTIPWAQILVDRSRLWQSCQQMLWHSKVPIKHAMAPIKLSEPCRMLFIVATLFPTPMVLVSVSIDRHQFCPVADFAAIKCNQHMVDTAQGWCSHLGLQSQAFPAGSSYEADDLFVSMAAPIQHAGQVDIDALSAILKPTWVHTKALHRGPLRFAAEIALERMRMFIGPSQALAEVLSNPFKIGKSHMAMLRTTKVAEKSDTISFKDAVRLSLQADNTLRSRLEDPITMVEFERDKAECLQLAGHTFSEYGDWGTPTDWASRIELMDLADVPEYMRQSTPVFDDPELDLLPFCDKCCPPATEWLPLTPNQKVDAAWMQSLSSREDLYVQHDAVALQHDWLRSQGQQCEDYVRHRKDATRWHNVTHVAAESLRHPNARGKIFDTSAADRVALVQFDEPKNMHLNKDFIFHMLQDTPDQEILSMIMLGFRLKAPLHTHSVYMPHGEALSLAYTQLEQQMLSQEALGMVDFYQQPPVDPMRLVSHGAVARGDDLTVSEILPLGENPRLTDNHSAPHHETVDADGHHVVPLNVAHKTDTIFPPNPHEEKPSIMSKSQSASILLNLSHKTGLPLRAIKADAKYFYNQLEVANEDAWKLCRVLRPIKSHHRLFSIGQHKRLGYGSTPASNYGQRFAAVFCAMIDKVMSWICDPYELYKDEPAVVEWLSRRVSLNSLSAKRQDTLWDTDQYTDDLFMLVLGDRVAVKAISAIHIVKYGTGVVMAGFTTVKNQIGSSMQWTGAHMYLMLGMACVPKRKQLKAIAYMKKLWSSKLMVKDYERFLGLVVHILYIARCEQLEATLSDLWAPTIFLGPTQYIKPQSFKHLHERWTVLDDNIHRHNAAYFWKSLPDCLLPHSFATVVHMFGDAYREHDSDPVEAGIGGFMEGYWWFHQVDPQVASLLFTPQLEAAAVPANFMVMEHILPSPQPHLGVAIHSDSMGTALNLRKCHARNPTMHFINEAFWKLPQVQQRQQYLMGSHLDGLANPAADCASRNMLHELAALSRSLNVKMVRLPVPSSVPTMLQSFADFEAQRRHMYEHHANRQMSAQESMMTPAFSSNKAGDGPADITRSPPGTPTRPVGSATPVCRSPATQQAVAAQPRATLSAPSAQATTQQPLRRSPRLGQSPPTTVHQHQSTSAIKRTLVLEHSRDTAPITRSPTGRHEMKMCERPTKQLKHWECSSLGPALTVDIDVSSKRETTVDRLLSAYESRPQYKISPQHIERLRDMVQTHLAYVDKGIPSSTKSNEKSALKKWQIFAAQIGFNPMRPPPVSLTLDELWVENMLLGLFGPFVWSIQVGRKHAQADPNSAMKVVALVNKVLGRHNDDRFDIKYAKASLTGMLVEHVDTHGPITVDRQHPFTMHVLAAMFRIPDGTPLGSYTLQKTSPEGANLFALFSLAPESGTRGDEVTVNGTDWTKRKMSKASLSWHVQGQIYTRGAPPEVLKNLDEDCYASITPATSKCDRWGKKHGNKPIILPFRKGRAYNAATALRDMELADPVYGQERELAPLFRNAQGDAFEIKFVRSLLKHWLSLPTVAMHRPSGVSRYSFHSFRRYYATCLGSSGASVPQIQSMCRWLSEEAVEIYNMMTDTEKIGLVDAAYLASPSVLTTKMIKQLNMTQIDDDELYRTWCTELRVDIEMLGTDRGTQ